MIVRSLLLLLPLAIWAGLLSCQRLSARQLTAMLFGFLWVFYSVLLGTVGGVSTGIMVFTNNDSLFCSVPIDWVISQAIITGALIPCIRLLPWGAGKIVRLLMQICAIVICIELSGVVDFQGYGVGVAAMMYLVALLPALLLSDWTVDEAYIKVRSLLQSLIWGVTLFWMFPSVIFHLTGDGWNVFLLRGWLINSLYVLPLILPGGLIISALYQFAVEGQGTAFPYDPPKRLVTGGVYGYISNPMQLGICIAMGWWGVVIESAEISVSGLIAFLLFIVFRDVCNGSCAIGKGNAEWEEYQLAVPKWRWKTKPWRAG